MDGQFSVCFRVISVTPRSLDELAPIHLTGAWPERISTRSVSMSSESPIEAQAFAALMLLGSASGVIGVDRAGRVVVMNDAAARMLGLGSPEPYIGLPCREALDACPDVARILLDAFETRTLPNRAELELRHRREGGPTIGYTLSLVVDPCRQIIGVSMFFKDLTSIERLEEQARLKDRLAALGEMAAGLAHEMRNPLAAIEIHAGLLRRAVDPAVAGHVESLEHILAEARRLNETVAACLDFVRPVEVAARPVALEPLLDAAAAEPGPGAIAVVREYAPGGTTALGDPVQLRQAFANLVRNAREASGPSGRVTLRTRPAGAGAPARVPGEEVLLAGVDADASPAVVVEVEDTGQGIAAEHRDRIFLPFFSTKPKGSGLGLAAVQKIVQSHRGRVDFGSLPAGGTVFRVVLPAAPEGIGS